MHSKDYVFFNPIGAHDIAEALADDAAEWIQQFALEGVALLELAAKRGMSLGREYLHCPEIVRGGSAFVYDPNAWREADFVPRRV